MAAAVQNDSVFTALRQKFRLISFYFSIFQIFSPVSLFETEMKC